GDPAPAANGTAFPGPDIVGGGSSARLRMFVGDGRPQQVIFREGLLYIARAAMEMDLNGNALGTSTVVYDILKQAGPACQTGTGITAGLGGPGPFCGVVAGCAQAPTWVATTTYAINALVQFPTGGQVYKSLQNGNLGNQPPNATWWVAVSATAV